MKVAMHKNCRKPFNNERVYGQEITDIRYNLKEDEGRAVVDITSEVKNIPKQWSFRCHACGDYVNGDEIEFILEITQVTVENKGKEDES